MIDKFDSLAAEGNRGEEDDEEEGESETGGLPTKDELPPVSASNEEAFNGNAESNGEGDGDPKVVAFPDRSEGDMALLFLADSHRDIPGP